MANSLENKVVVVLGASRGYGAAASDELLLRGATVVMGAHQSLELRADTTRPGPGRSVPVHVDVRRRQDVFSLAQQVRDEFGRIDAWVNTASIGTVGHFDEISLDSHVDVIETDLLGTLYGSYAAIEQFQVQDDGGVLINVAADPDSLDLPYMVSYAAAKHGVVGLTSALRAEARSQAWKNIHICSVLPGDQAKLESHELGAQVEVHAPPSTQAAVLDRTGEVIAELIIKPRDVIKVHGTRYFL